MSTPLFYRYYEEFKIDKKTGESNLTQMYLQVSEGSLISGDTTLFVEPARYTRLCFTVYIGKQLIEKKEIE